MTTQTVVMRAAVAALLGAGVLSVLPATAHASCGRLEQPSPHAFIGTVIDTDELDRVATVVTDAGRQVQVLGTRDPGWWSNAYSSTDRRYALGARYEFHPLNDESPYRDNSCTATTHLAGPHPAPDVPRREYLPGWLPVDEQAGPGGYLLFGAAAALPIAAVAAVLRWRHRRSRSRHRGLASVPLTGAPT